MSLIHEAVRQEGITSMSHRIFIVEDHPAMCRAYTQMISAAEGLETCGLATSGEEALHRIPTSNCDLVLLDISLPGMNGLEVSRALLAEVPDLPVLIVSGHERKLYFDRNHSQIGPNVRGYITKEQGPTELLKAIQWLLTHKGERLPD